MDQNPYKAPEAGIESSIRQLPKRRTISAAAMRGALIGGGIMFGLSALGWALMFRLSIADGPIVPRDDAFHLSAAVVSAIIWTPVGSVVGAALGALFRAIANALTTEKTPPAN